MTPNEIQSHTSSGQLALSSAWSDICSGRARIITSRATSNRYVLHLARSPQRGRVPRRDHLDLLQRVLLGRSQKAVALETGCSPSTIASKLSECLAAIGLSCKLSRVPAILVQVVHALYGDPRAARIELHANPDGTLQLEAERPEAGLAPLLSSSEINVIALLAEGRSYAEIARQRATAVRTIANQVSSAYRKLRVSGRIELLCYLADNVVSGRPGQPAPHAVNGVNAVNAVNAGAALYRVGIPAREADFRCAV